MRRGAGKWWFYPPYVCISALSRAHIFFWAVFLGTFRTTYLDAGRGVACTSLFAVGTALLALRRVGFGPEQNPPQVYPSMYQAELDQRTLHGRPVVRDCQGQD